MGGIKVNDRAVSLLEQYELEVISTRKGRGAILCESRQGLYILKEYTGSGPRAAAMDFVLTRLQENGLVPVDCVLPNKEGELITTDTDGTRYMVKSWYEGRECNVKELKECEQAVETLAKLHNGMTLGSQEALANMPVFSLKEEYERHNRELKKVRRFLKEKSQKTEFELFLNSHFDFFLEQAKQVLAEWEGYAHLEQEEEIRREGTLCHGDYQYHNIIVKPGGMAVINFEKLIFDRPIRDLYLFLRKILEKNNWSKAVGEQLLTAYDKKRSLSAMDRISLLYRFAYPEKFWKIVNFYYNSGKAWIPGKNMEKLQKLLLQEKEKESFLEELRVL